MTKVVEIKSEEQINAIKKLMEAQASGDPERIEAAEAEAKEALSDMIADALMSRTTATAAAHDNYHNSRPCECGSFKELLEAAEQEVIRLNSTDHCAIWSFSIGVLMMAASSRMCQEMGATPDDLGTLHRALLDINLHHGKTAKALVEQAKERKGRLQ